MAQDVSSEISSVNLLDPECEPTDEQLAMIMRAVAVEAKERAARQRGVSRLDRTGSGSGFGGASAKDWNTRIGTPWNFRRVTL